MSELYPSGPSTSLGNGFEDKVDYEIPRGSNEGHVVSFVEYPEGRVGKCTDCMYMEGDKCKNKDSRIYDRVVTGRNCCNYFNTVGMKVIV